MAARRALSILPSALRLRGLTSVAFQPAELQGVYNFGASSGTTQPGEIGIVSGVPDAHLNRKVVIYSPARVASQQGAGNTGQWKISFESTQKWENPLMGWTSTGDPYSSVGEASLYFDTKEAAMDFASKYGWEFTVREPHQKAIRTKAYADKFKWKGPAEEE